MRIRAARAGSFMSVPSKHRGQGNHRPGRGRATAGLRASRRSRAAAAAIVVVVALAVGYLAVQHRMVTERATACLAGSGTSGLALSVSQAGIASTIAGVASKRALPSRAVAIAYRAELHSSQIRSLPYSER